MKIITSNQCNGGCGKTSLVRNLAQALRLNGMRVLEIDLDFQKSLTNVHQYKPNPYVMNYTSFDLFTHTEIDINQTIINDLIVGNASNNEPLTFMMMNNPNNELILKDALTKLINYDYVIIDTHNAMNTATKNAIACSDLLLLPCNDDVDCINGSIQVIYGANQIKQKYNTNLKMAFVFTMQHRTGKYINVADKNAYNGACQIANKYGMEIMPVIRYDSKVNKSKQCLMDVFEYCNRYEKELCNGANDYMELAKYIINNY